MKFKWLLFVCAVLASCASPSTRLEWNLKRAVVHKSVRLPRADVEQIIRVVSRESIFPILLITGGKTERGDYEVTVYTDLSHDPQRYMEYDLQKRADGQWHIVSSGEGSIIVVDQKIIM
jgi:hypothetical protein